MELDLEEETDLNTMFNAALSDIPVDPAARNTAGFSVSEEGVLNGMGDGNSLIGSW